MRLPILFSIFFVTAFIGGCKSPSTVEDNDLGTLMGKVVLNDVHCNTISNRSGITVAVQGTGFTAHVDSLGQWRIDNIPAGIYNVILAKPGFDTDLRAEYEFSGAGTQFLEHETLYELPPDSVPILAFLVSSRDSILINVSAHVTNTYDTARHRVDSTITYDTTYDTLGNAVTIDLSLTMAGMDSSVEFAGVIRDLSRAVYPQWPYSGYSSITRGAVVNSHTTGIYTSNYPGPQRGDTLVVTTYTVGCGDQHYGPHQSKTFVIP